MGKYTQAHYSSDVQESLDTFRGNRVPQALLYHFLHLSLLKEHSLPRFGSFRQNYTASETQESNLATGTYYPAWEIIIHDNKNTKMIIT